MYNQWPNHIMYSLVETVKIKTFSIPFDFPHRSKDHTQTKQNKSIFIFSFGTNKGVRQRECTQAKRKRL